MPQAPSVLRQSTKKRPNGQQPADFKKLKFKVGRKAPQRPANETQTSFKAKRVVVREQSVATEVQLDQVGARKQTVEQLTSLTLHHHQRVRKGWLVIRRRLGSIDGHVILHCTWSSTSSFSAPIIADCIDETASCSFIPDP